MFPRFGNIYHLGYVLPRWGTHITRDMCFLDGETHITKDTCFPGGGTHITRDMCFPGGGAHITKDMCFVVDKVFHKKKTYRSRLKEFLLFF